MAKLTDEMKDLLYKNHVGLVASVDENGNPDLMDRTRGRFERNTHIINRVGH